MSLTGRIIKRQVIKFIKEESTNLVKVLDAKGSIVDAGINATIVGGITKIHWSSIMTILLLKFMGLIGIKLPEGKK